MDFVGRTLLRLVDSDEREAIFTPAVGDRALHAAFEVRNAEVGVATGVLARDVDVFPAANAAASVDGTMHDPMSAARWEVHGTYTLPRRWAPVHAVAELRVTTEMRRAGATIERVDSRDLAGVADVEAVDARIVADDGALPGDPDDLAARRFVALKAELLDRFDNDDEVDIDDLAGRLGGADFDSLAAALTEPHHLSNVAVEIVIDGTRPARIATHRIVAGVVIENDPIADLPTAIERARLAAAELSQTVEQSPAPEGMAARSSLPTVVVFPETALDDADLPIPAGANPANADERRAARLMELSRRIVRLGIALAPIA